MDKKQKNKVRQYIEREWPSALAFGTILPNYMITEDPTFTRERTGAGSIEYFNEPYINYGTEENPNIILNPNGETPTLLYDPNTNTAEDVKLDLLHHYREYDPVYLELLRDYEQSLQPEKSNILWNSLLGEIFREKYNNDDLEYSKHWDEWDTMVNTTPSNSLYMLQGVDGSLRNLLASDATIKSSNYAPREVAEQQWLSNPEARKAFNNILSYLTSYRLPEVTVYGNRKNNGGPLHPDWNELSMRDRAAYIRMGVANGFKDIDSIRNVYNEFRKGGKRNSWYSLHRNRWNTFLLNSGVSAEDAARLSTFFAALDGLESANGTSNAARLKNNYGGMLRNGKNITYSSIDDYMADKWKMMNNRFKPALSARTIEEYATILGDPNRAGKGYLYYVADGYNPKDPRNRLWVAALNAHMNNYILGMLRYAGTPTRKYMNVPVILLNTVELPDALRVTRSPLVLLLLDKAVLLPVANGDDIAFTGTIPEIVVTPKEKRLYINPEEMLAYMNSMVTPYTPIDYSMQPIYASERMKLFNNDRITLLLRDLEDSIIRNNLLDTLDSDRLRRDAEDLRFYRNMSAYGGNLFPTGGNKNSEVQGAIDYVKSYYNSPGFDSRFRNVNRYAQDFLNSKYNYSPSNILIPEKGNFLLDDVTYDNNITDNAFYNEDNKEIILGNINFPLVGTANNYGEVTAHEAGHALDASVRLGERPVYNGIQAYYTPYSDIFPIFRKSKSYRNKIGSIGPAGQREVDLYPSIYIEHDGLPRESYADLILLRYELDKAGIYDSKKANNPFTKELLLKYKGLKSGNTHNRLFDEFSDDDIIWMINNIAQNDIKLTDNMAAYGGNLFPKGGPIIKVNPGDRVDTDLCAAWSNRLLRDNGYLVNGNAWSLGNVDLLFNGYNGLTRPETYDSRLVTEYNHAATDNVFKNFDSKTLDITKPYVVNMYYNNSPSLEEAYNNGDGVTGTHTGVLTFDPEVKKWYVTHNIHGNIHQEPFIDLQRSSSPYGVTAIYAPRENTIWNRLKGFFGFANGGPLVNMFLDGGDIPYNYFIDEVESPMYRTYMMLLATNRAKAKNERWNTDRFTPEDEYNHMINDSTYNYRRWYNMISPLERQEALNMGVGHWADKYGKTYLHPTFSIESPYSGYVNPYNPYGVVGGTWLNTGDPHNERYEFSDSQMANNWPINKTLEEFQWAREHEDTNPYAMYKGGFVLPEVVITGKKHSIGGSRRNY